MSRHHPIKKIWELQTQHGLLLLWQIRPESCALCGMNYRTTPSLCDKPCLTIFMAWTTEQLHPSVTSLASPSLWHELQNNSILLWQASLHHLYGMNYGTTPSFFDKPCFTIFMAWTTEQLHPSVTSLASPSLWHELRNNSILLRCLYASLPCALCIHRH